MTDYITEIALFAEGLYDGQVSRDMSCPICKGGSSREKAFLIYRQPTTAIYKCYRVSCGYGGKISLKTRASVSRQQYKKQRIFDKATYPLKQEHCDNFYEEFEITSEALSRAGVKRTEESFVYPIRTLRDGTVGILERWYDWYSPAWGPKCMYYPVMDSLRLAQFSVLNTDTCVIVEDFVSALKYSTLVDSTAILGTSLTDAVVERIRSKYKNIIISLDADATAKAIKYYKKYGVYFDRAGVMLLEKDPKDTPYELLQQKLEVLMT